MDNFMKTLNKLSFLATGIGSMPHSSINDALDITFKGFADMPVWPQLPALSKFEDMTLQYSSDLPGLVFDEEENRYFVDSSSEDFYEKLESFLLDYEEIVENKNLESLSKYNISETYSRSIRPWLERVAKMQPIALKGQIIGPFTYCNTLTDVDKKNVYYDETLKEMVEKFLTIKALWQLEQFKKVCPNSTYIISIDEPSVSQYGSSAFLTVEKDDIITSINNVSDVITSFGALTSVHCCGKTDWSIITSSNVNILSFDAYNFSDSIALYPQDIKNFLDRDGIIAWGLVPTVDPSQIESVTIDQLLKIFEKTKSLLVEKGVSESKIIVQSIITPSCGTGSLSTDLSEKSIYITGELSKILRSKYS